jgi:hypothetical protein
LTLDISAFFVTLNLRKIDLQLNFYRRACVAGFAGVIPRVARVSSQDVMMKTAEILKKIDIPRHKLYYLEQKGYISPKRIPMGDLEAREYSEEDILKIKLIWKYLKRGFKHKMAYQKAIAEMKAVNT